MLLYCLNRLKFQCFNPIDFIFILDWTRVSLIPEVLSMTCSTLHLRFLQIIIYIIKKIKVINCQLDYVTFIFILFFHYYI